MKVRSTTRILAWQLLGLKRRPRLQSWCGHQTKTTGFQEKLLMWWIGLVIYMHDHLLMVCDVPGASFKAWHPLTCLHLAYHVTRSHFSISIRISKLCHSGSILKIAAIRKNGCVWLVGARGDCAYTQKVRHTHTKQEDNAGLGWITY